MEEEICLICNQQNEDSLVTAGTKAKETLLRFAKIRNDVEIENSLKTIENIKVHASCRRDFTNERRLSSTKDPPTKKRKLRSVVNCLQFSYPINKGELILNLGSTLLSNINDFALII